jgi:hypothetical protein
MAARKRAAKPAASAGLLLVTVTYPDGGRYLETTAATLAKAHAAGKAAVKKMGAPLGATVLVADNPTRRLAHVENIRAPHLPRSDVQHREIARVVDHAGTYRKVESVGHGA